VIREFREKYWKSDNISGLDAYSMYKSMASIWARSLSELQSSGIFVFRASFQIPLGESNPYHRWTINSTTICIAWMLADLNLFIRARDIFVFPLQELRGKIPIGDLYSLYSDCLSLRSRHRYSFQKLQDLKQSRCQDATRYHSGIDISGPYPPGDCPQEVNSGRLRLQGGLTDNLKEEKERIDIRTCSRRNRSDHNLTQSPKFPISQILLSCRTNWSRCSFRSYFNHSLQKCAVQRPHEPNFFAQWFELEQQNLAHFTAPRKKN
jgi:hypothetical protein